MFDFIDVKWVGIAYWICFLSGMVYAVIGGLMGSLFGFEHGGDGGGVGGDGMGHGDASAGESGSGFDIAPLSPAVVAAFLVIFGGTGLILTDLFDLSISASLPISIVVAFTVDMAVFTMLYRIFRAVQASSEPIEAALVGLAAEVTVSIPAQGVGQIAYICRGGRYTASARSEGQLDISVHGQVRIVRVVGSTLYVKRPAEGEEIEMPMSRPRMNGPLRD